ncbi:uncharacterized protein J3R85_004537 [Psidium guajava]|nr:uncharacterized protein J3R85_004537 [Psidium guajava]
MSHSMLGRFSFLNVQQDFNGSVYNKLKRLTTPPEIAFRQHRALSLAKQTASTSRETRPYSSKEQQPKGTAAKNLGGPAQGGDSETRGPIPPRISIMADSYLVRGFRQEPLEVSRPVCHAKPYEIFPLCLQLHPLFSTLIFALAISLQRAGLVYAYG